VHTVIGGRRSEEYVKCGRQLSTDERRMVRVLGADAA